MILGLASVIYSAKQENHVTEPGVKGPVRFQNNFKTKKMKGSQKNIIPLERCTYILYNISILLIILLKNNNFISIY